jgi:transcriptional regulator with XRE-family HTH domain
MLNDYRLLPILPTAYAGSHCETMSGRLTGATVGERIVEAYKKAGLNRNQLSKQTHLDYATIIQWEQGKKNPRGDSLVLVATATGFSVDEILGLAPPPSAHLETDTSEGPAAYQAWVADGNLERFRVSPEAAELLKQAAGKLGLGPNELTQAALAFSQVNRGTFQESQAPEVQAAKERFAKGEGGRKVSLKKR